MGVSERRFIEDGYLGVDTHDSRRALSFRRIEPASDGSSPLLDGLHDRVYAGDLVLDGAINSGVPRSRFRNQNMPIGSGGLWGLSLGNTGVLRFELNAAAAGDFSAANQPLLLNPDLSVDIAVGALKVGGTPLFENDRDLAADIIPNATGTLDLGSPTRHLALSYVDLGTFGSAGTLTVGGATIQTSAGTNLQLDGGNGILIHGQLDGTSRNATIMRTANADAGNTLRNSHFLYYGGAYWDGAASQTRSIASRLSMVTTAPSYRLDWFDQGATRILSLYNDGTLDLATGVLQIGGVPLFENDRDLAVSLTPNADNSLTDGTASRRWASAHSVIFDVRAAAGDVNPTARLLTSALSLGVNSADALSVSLSVATANRLDLATGDSLRLVNGDLQYGTSGTGVRDVNGNELLLYTQTASAVNELTLANAATANSPSLSATGGDANISLLLNAKGTGNVNVGVGGFAIGGTLLFEADRDLAVDLLGNADATLDLGSAARRFAEAHVVTAMLGALQPGVEAKSANYTVLATDGITFLPATTGAGGITITLPTAATKRLLIIKKVDAGVGALTIARAGADTIDGAASVSTTTQYAAYILISDGGTAWSVI